MAQTLRAAVAQNLRSYLVRRCKTWNVSREYYGRFSVCPSSEYYFVRVTDDVDCIEIVYKLQLREAIVTGRTADDFADRVYLDNPNYREVVYQRILNLESGLLDYHDRRQKGIPHTTAT